MADEPTSRRRGRRILSTLLLLVAGWLTYRRFARSPAGPATPAPGQGRGEVTAPAPTASSNGSAPVSRAVGAAPPATPSSAAPVEADSRPSGSSAGAARPKRSRAGGESAPAPQPLFDAGSPGTADEPFGPGSARPLPDGSAPGPEYTIKGNAGSMLFHTAASPYYGRTKPEAWFRTAEDAVRAGFTEWKPKRRNT